MGKIVVDDKDVFVWFDNLKEGVDVWITDPPYPFDNKNGQNRFKYIDGEDGMYSRLDWPEIDKTVMHMMNKTNDGGRAYIFCNKDTIFRFRESIEKAGWTYRNIIPWDKKSIGMGYHWRNQYEYVLYVTKGKPKVYITKKANKFEYKKPRKSAAIPGINYEVEGISCKPYEIWQDIITHGVLEDEIIADPFAGSNPMRAALLLDNDLYDKVGKAYTNCLKV